MNVLHPSAPGASGDGGAPGAAGGRATVFLIVDGGRADYVGQGMPFLEGLARRGLRGRFVSPPGFAQRTAFFTGRYPDTSGRFAAFAFDPGGSPFRWVGKLGPLGRLVRPRLPFAPARWAIRAITARLTDCYHPDPAWIPPTLLPSFRPCEDMRPVHAPGALGAPSLFDLCRARGLGYRYLAHPVSGDDEAVLRALVRELRAGAPVRLYVAQFSRLDQQGHRHGPHAPVMRRDHLPLLDRAIAAVHAALCAGYREWDLFVCADHGMAPVWRRVNLLQQIARLPARFPRDYAVFVNSTMAHFWFGSERGRAALEQALPRVQGCRVLSQEERRARRIPADRAWGDMVLAAEPGVLLWPDFFHVAEARVRGMHGYLDKREEGAGMAVLASSDGALRGDFPQRPLVDAFPTLCELLGVPTPVGQEGQSVLEARAVIA